jgi:hypothetical protein
MYKELGQVTLKTGERAAAGVVVGPDLEWAERIEKLLEHKGDIWNWQNSQMVRSEPGIEARFYVLHRDGDPFANIASFELAGVGDFGHVWTRPEDRQKGACAALMELQMADFIARQGQALFLETGFDSAPYHIYERFGFRGIEPQSGTMAWYADSREAFDARYFARGETTIEPATWAHWPSSLALFLGDFSCVVRCLPLKLVGRQPREGAFLSLLRDEEKRRLEGKEPRAMVLKQAGTMAVVGFAAWGWHPLWPDTCLLDVYCHPHHWDRAAELLGALTLPDGQRFRPNGQRVVAYADADCAHKAPILSAFGFRQTGTLRRWVAADWAQTSFVDVAVYAKT